MSGKRTCFFLLLYATILAVMLFMFMFVQTRYGVDTSGPYKRRFLDKFFLQAPVHSLVITQRVHTHTGTSGVLAGSQFAR